MQSNTPDQTEFFRLLATGDQERIRVAISNNPAILDSFDYRNFGATPLTAACFSNHSSTVELLIELGADPDRRSDWHRGPWSPLHCAIFRRDKRLAQFLLANGATLDVHTAAGLGDSGAVARLLDDDPSRVAERGGDGCLPLHFADTIEVAQLLLDRGADIDSPCIDHHSTPVQYLCTSRPDVARFLLAAGAQPDIFSAAACGDTQTVERLLIAAPDLLHARINPTFLPPGDEPNVYNILTFTIGHEATPLHAAAKGDRSEVVSFLVRSGLSANVRGGYDQATPLHTTAWNNCQEAARALLDNGADMEARSGRLHNNTPAGWAIVSGADDVFQLLLDSGAQLHPWFVDDARDARDGRFDQVSNASRKQRDRILALLSGYRAS